MTNPTERAKTGLAHAAMAFGKRPKFAAGGMAAFNGNFGGVTGPLLGTDGGRTDTLPIKVPSGAYVIPSDVVSGIKGAEGNTLAGHKIWDKLLSEFPYDTPASGPLGIASPKLGKGNPFKKRAHGGLAGQDDEGGVDIMAASGEHVVDPEIIKGLGRGNMKLGHEIMDEIVKHVREQNIKDLKKLPPPVKK